MTEPTDAAPARATTDTGEKSVKTEARSAGAGTSETSTASGSGQGTSSPRRRRRRGRGRGRGGSTATKSAAEGSQQDAAETTQSAAQKTRSAAQKTQKTQKRTEKAEPEEAGSPGGDAGEPKPSGQRRRRRRGGRGRGGSKSTAAGAEAGTADSAGAAKTTDGEPATGAPSEAPDADPPAASTTSSSKSRSRRRRRSGVKKTAGETPSLDDPPEGRGAAASKQKPPTRKDAKKVSAKESGIATVAGPTRMRRPRLTSTRARSRRRREPVIIPPRVTDKLMVITEHGERDQIAVLEERDLVQHYVTRIGATSMVGNVYLGRVQNVLPGMEAAFVDVGRGRNAVLYAGEVNYSAEELEGETPPRIEEVLKPGQSLLVQVTKDPMGGKGARLTAQISMPGRFLVFVPKSNVFGISRRIPEEDRKRLKAIAKRIKPDGHGVIIRTAAEGADEEKLADDLDRVRKAWADIEKRAKKVKAPAVVYEEPELTVRVVRDLFTDEEFRELVTDSPRIHQEVTSYLREVAPDLAEKVRLHEGKLPVFEEFHVVEQIHKALDRKVWLPSGGYLIVERTEAMTVIDVNTGKSVGRTNLEETVTNTNLEAARETARQLRLRDIGGIIIIDFIDMLLEKNKKKVTDTLREAMAMDKTRSQVFEIGPLGLLEVTRKRVSGGLVESFSETCPHCEGRGILLNYEA